jgi:rhodanese-related sulfurtransferase
MILFGKMRRRRFAAPLLAGLGAALVASVAMAGELPAKKVTKAGLYVDAAHVARMLEDETVMLVDIRSRAEVAFLGLPTRTNVHIPYMVMPLVPEYDAKAKGYALEINPDFPQEFEAFVAAKGLAKDSRIVLMCRSGSRSARAADLLFEMGYTNVYSLVDGFEGDKAKDGPEKGRRMVNGWKNAGLEWSYSISESQAYPGDVM